MVATSRPLKKQRQAKNTRSLYLIHIIPFGSRPLRRTLQWFFRGCFYCLLFFSSSSYNTRRSFSACTIKVQLEKAPPFLGLNCEMPLLRICRHFKKMKAAAFGCVSRSLHFIASFSSSPQEVANSTERRLCASQSIVASPLGIIFQLLAPHGAIFLVFFVARNELHFRVTLLFSRDFTLLASFSS